MQSQVPPPESLPTRPPDHGDQSDFSNEREANDFQRSERLLGVVHYFLIGGIGVVFLVALAGVIIYAIHLLSPVQWLDESALAKIENTGLGFLIAAFTMLLRRALDR